MENTVVLGDCFDVFNGILDNSIDAVVTDPPYKYLDHKIETNWDERLFFAQCFRALKTNSYLVFFGKGRSFFRWCVIAEQAGFVFKEDIVWDKIRSSNPLCDMLRKHESIAIFAKGKPRFNKVYIDKLEYDLLGNPRNIIDSIKKVISEINSIKSYEEFIDFKKGVRDTGRQLKKSVSARSELTRFSRGGQAFKALNEGNKFSSVYRFCLNNQSRNHPTEKPVILLQDLIKLTTDENDTVLDPFCGSGTTAIACKELKRNYICIEKDQEYYQIACNRLNQPIPAELERVDLSDQKPPYIQLSLF